MGNTRPHPCERHPTVSTARWVTRGLAPAKGNCQLSPFIGRASLAAVLSRCADTRTSAGGGVQLQPGRAAGDPPLTPLLCVPLGVKASDGQYGRIGKTRPRLVTSVTRNSSIAFRSSVLSVSRKCPTAIGNS
eukprot:1176677-Prorocentrum_minimum.AAC.1